MSQALDSFWRAETPYLIAAAIVLALLLIRLRPAERDSYRNTLILFFIGLSGQLTGVLMGSAHYRVAGEVVGEVFFVLAALAVVRLAGFAVFRLLLPAIRLHPPRIAEDLVITSAYVLFAVVQLRDAGFDLTGILATSAVVTGLVAFAMQDTLANVLGGLVLQLDSSIQVGDWIKIDSTVGQVMDIGWRSTLIETGDNETVVFPNSALMKERFVVVGRRDGSELRVRRWIAFSVDPAVPPGRVIEVVEGCLRDTEIPYVANDRPASCVLLGFEQGNLNFALRYWLANMAAGAPTDSLVRTHLFAALQRAGIRIAEPQETLHNIDVDERHAERVHERELGRRLVLLKGMDLFSTLTDAERQSLAERLQYTPFARGDIITRQGDTSHWLYILASGEAEVSVAGARGEKRVLGTLGPGSFFGEMGLMTGAPRTATAQARTDLDCYRLDKGGFQDLMLSRPALAAEISHIITTRTPGLSTAQHEVVEAGAHGPDDRYQEMLARIRHFFGLTFG